jgi:KDO2-lipid IV(A) lauroyltransferase
MWDRARAGQGGLLVGGHSGNWELGPRCLRLCGVNARAVMRPVDNRLIDRHAIAARGGPETVIPKRGAVRAVMGTLRDGGWVALLADQNAGRGGVFAPFFGLPASTHPLPAVLALRLRLPLYAAACLRRPGATYAFDIHIRRIDTGPPDDEVTDERVDAVVARMTAAIEGFVREAPAQYNWVHRRWKSRPPGEPAGPHQPAYAVPYGAPGWAGSGGFRRRIRG